MGLQRGSERDMGVSQNWGYPFKGPQNKDCSVGESILGSQYLGKSPYHLLPNSRVQS